MRRDKFKQLPESYNYYMEVSKKIKRISKEIFKEENNQILEQKLYNLVINICNQVIYNCKYSFTKDDLYFIVDYDIDIHLVVEEFKEDIIKCKESM